MELSQKEMNQNREKEYKIEGKQIKYFNGEYWLIKETFRTKKEALEILNDLNARITN